MQYQTICEGRFVARPNRFIAHVETEEGLQVCHVKNTGRCRELLVPGARVWLEECANPARKTKYDLITVEKPTARGPLLINMDSQAPNRVAEEAIAQGKLLLPGFDGPPALLRREVTQGESRFDLFAGGNGPDTFVEVKGVTLEEKGGVFFPDAPTIRGARHLRRLAALSREGTGAAVLFVIQMERADFFAPNRRTHPDFAQALLEAAQSGVTLLAHRCRVTPSSLVLDDPVPILLEPSERSDTL